MNARPSIELASTQHVEPLWFGKQHIVIALGRTPFAIPLLAVQEVENPPPVVPVPFAPSWIAGIINLRGTVLTLVDLPALLGLGVWRRGAEAKMLVLRGDERVAVAVDALHGMRRLPEQDRSHIAGALPGQVARYVSAMYRSDDDLLGILDIERLLAESDMNADTSGNRVAAAPSQRSRNAVANVSLDEDFETPELYERGTDRAFTF